MAQDGPPSVKDLGKFPGGLDLILGGGLKPGSVVVLAGPPGAGKTILAQQICFANAGVEHKAVYYTTLSEPHSKLVEHLQGFSFFDPAALGPKVEYVHLGDMLRDTGTSGLEPLISEVVRNRLRVGGEGLGGVGGFLGPLSGRASSGLRGWRDLVDGGAAVAVASRHLPAQWLAAPVRRGRGAGLEPAGSTGIHRGSELLRGCGAATALNTHVWC